MGSAYDLHFKWYRTFAETVEQLEVSRKLFILEN